MPSHMAAIPRQIAPKVRETGPCPLRTARGAGREAGREDALDRLRPFAELLRGAGRLLVLRDRVLEPNLLVVRDVLELRGPGGEDVRVAMVRTLRRRHTSHTDHMGACRAPRGARSG
jgi:hypothetical protein